MAIDPTKRNACTQDEILLAIVERLINAIGELNDQDRVFAGQSDEDALLGRDASTGEVWEPSVDDRPLLRDMLSPLSCDSPHDVAVGETIATAMQIKFSTVFDWDLA